MTTKHNGIYIETNAENAARVQRLLFEHGIFWGVSGAKIQTNFRNLVIYKTNQVECPNIIYCDYGERCTLKVTGDGKTRGAVGLVPEDSDAGVDVREVEQDRSEVGLGNGGHIDPACSIACSIIADHLDSDISSVSSMCESLRIPISATASASDASDPIRSSACRVVIVGVFIVFFLVG